MRKNTPKSLFHAEKKHKKITSARVVLVVRTLLSWSRVVGLLEGAVVDTTAALLLQNLGLQLLGQLYMLFLRFLRIKKKIKLYPLQKEYKCIIIEGTEFQGRFISGHIYNILRKISLLTSTKLSPVSYYVLLFKNTKVGLKHDMLLSN